MLFKKGKDILEKTNMDFINDKMSRIINNLEVNNNDIKTILEKRTGIFSTEIIEFDNMVLWNEYHWDRNKFKSLNWNHTMHLFRNVVSRAEFLGYNRIDLSDNFSDLSKDQVIIIGCICFDYWKEKLKKEFPQYHFFIRFYYQEYDNGEFDSLVGFHRVRFTETLGSTDIIEMPNPAVMFAVI